ncbi:hypothetical protein PR048_023609 [Dryococelus australis]|uniref:Uncharacterized protein n=1 Tax=Dryococelus australis TaxID=614101 RepID=A0ABQ9GUJ3_9NEOP|nr:hypothetical protein PR048_023609 [Dryococelus australis]
MKIRNVKTLTQSRSPEELALAAQLSNRSSGKRNVAEIIKGATTSSPRSVERAKRSFEIAKGTGLGMKPMFRCEGNPKREMHVPTLHMDKFEKLRVSATLRYCFLQIPKERYSCKMTHKWGCDGSSGHSGYKQKFSETHVRSTDSDVLMISVVPLQLTFQIKDSQEKNLFGGIPEHPPQDTVGQFASDLSKKPQKASETNFSS